MRRTLGVISSVLLVGVFNSNPVFAQPGIGTGTGGAFGGGFGAVKYAPDSCTWNCGGVSVVSAIDSPFVC